uniref:Acyl_transf_3 domain-containing protein n=2 Tax=Caenorhabditis tropicalis TaxID=1561998 RepID=A0A1I7V4K2_9PELO
MCMLLKRAENQSTCSLISLFYSKRFKRILPLYLLVILYSIISLYCFFPDTAVENNQKSAVHALLFVSNRPKTNEENYFEMLSIGVDIFTHTWSLSVEIQFYFLVPFIFLVSTIIPEKFKYFYYGIVGSISFIYYSSSLSIVAFNSVFARIWQFVIGMIVYLLANTEAPEPSYQKLNVEELNETVKLLEEGVTEEVSESSVQKRIPVKLISYVLPSLLILITAFPFNLTSVVTRPFVTIATGILMLISEDNVILSNRFLTYIGDISYSLYLIHWPIYAYWKLTCEGDKYCMYLLSH